MNLDKIKKYAFIRFDIMPAPNLFLLKSMRKHVVLENHDPILITQPGCFITMFESKSNYQDIYIDFKNDLKESKTGKTFLLIDVTEADIAHTYPGQYSDYLNKFLDKQTIEVSPDENLTIEELKLQLKEAITNENYELCNHIQNKINKIK